MHAENMLYPSAVHIVYPHTDAHFCILVI